MRTGAGGIVWPRLVGPLGPRASAAVLIPAAASAAATALATSRRVGTARGAAVGVVASDLVGGLVAFQLTTTRGAYTQSSWRSRMTFALLHVQPFLLPLVGEGSWRRAGARYLGVVAATALLEGLAGRSPSRRLMANGIAVAASAGDVLSDRSAQRWFGPVYLLKVIGGHAGIPRPLTG